MRQTIIRNDGSLVTDAQTSAVNSSLFTVSPIVRWVFIESIIYDTVINLVNK